MSRTEYDNPPAQNMDLRDFFAAHAPDSVSNYVPADWTFPEPRPEKPRGYDYWARGGSAAATDAESEACRRYDNDLTIWEHKRTAAKLIVGKWGYADAMLAARSSPTPNTPGGAS